MTECDGIGHDLADATLIPYASSRYPIAHADPDALPTTAQESVTITVAVTATVPSTHSPMRRQAGTSSPGPSSLPSFLVSAPNPAPKPPPTSPKIDMSLSKPTVLKPNSPVHQPQPPSPLHQGSCHLHIPIIDFLMQPEIATPRPVGMVRPWVSYNDGHAAMCCEMRRAGKRGRAPRRRCCRSISRWRQGVGMEQVFGRAVWLWKDGGGECRWSDGHPVLLVCVVFHCARGYLFVSWTSLVIARVISRFKPMSSIPLLSFS